MTAFLHGTTYYHFANPREEWAANFAAMRGMGLNCVRVAEIWPGWEVLEPRPGEFDFAELDEYVATAAGAGLAVIMGVGINNPPFWVFADVPDLRCRDVGGKTAVRRVQAANHDNAEYRRLMERFIEAQAKHYAGRPEIVAWQFGNEVRYGVDLPDNEATRVRFRGWLLERFDGDLDVLNRRWGVFHRDWCEVFPYRSPAGAPTEGLSPLAIATRQYKAWSLAELIAWGCGILRRHVGGVPIFHNSHGTSGETYSHWDIAAPCDVVCQDIYSATGGDGQTANSVMIDVAASVARSAGKELWIGETGVGQYGTFHRTRPPRRLIECLQVEMLAAGAKTLLHFQHKCPRYEQPHKFTGSQGTLRRDGSELPYANTPRRIAELMGRIGERLLAARPVRPQVAVYWPEESLRFSQDADYKEIQHTSVCGAASLFVRAGLPIQFLDSQRLIEAALAQFRLVYLPVSYLLPAAVGEALAKYVRGGGMLAAECRAGYVNEDGWLYEHQPGAGLHEVFGAAEDLFWNAPAMRASVLLGGRTIAATFPKLFQTFRLFGAECIATSDDGECVATAGTFGRGRAVAMGFAPSMFFPPGGGKYEGGAQKASAAEADQRAAIELISALAAEAGVERPMEIACDSIRTTTRYLESARERLAFVINHGAETAVTLPPGAEVIARSVGDGLDFAPASGRITLPPLHWAAVSQAKA